MVTLGNYYSDRLTGYSGWAIARCEYLHDAASVKLQRLDGEGAPEEFWFDELRLEADPVEEHFTAGFGR